MADSGTGRDGQPSFSTKGHSYSVLKEGRRDIVQRDSANTIDPYTHKIGSYVSGGLNIFEFELPRTTGKDGAPDIRRPNIDPIIYSLARERERE